MELIGNNEMKSCIGFWEMHISSTNSHHLECLLQEAGRVYSVLRVEELHLNQMVMNKRKKCQLPLRLWYKTS